MKKVAKIIGLVILVSILFVTCLVIMPDSQVINEFTEKNLEKFHRIKGPLSLDDTWVLKFVNENYISPPSNEPYVLSYVHDRAYADHVHGDTWRYIHKYMYRIFIDEPPGFFLEAGALDGEFLSNTLWMERSLGWTGLLIEPDKKSFHLLKEKHRKAWTSNACISKENFPIESQFVSLVLRDSTYELGVPKMYFPANSHLYDTDIYKANLTDTVPALEIYSQVQCFPLITFIQALGVKKIDFLSLDLQGNEKLILRYFPWSKVSVRVVVVEEFTSVVDQDFIEFMEKHNYQLVNREDLPKIHDHIYIKKDETILIDKVKEWRGKLPKKT